MKSISQCAVWWILVILVGRASAGPDATVRLRLTIDEPQVGWRPGQFGWSLDTFNDDLLVGGKDGSVFVIDASTGEQSLRLKPPEGFGSFGRAISQFGHNIVVGANELDWGPHVSVGSAYVFDGSTGVHLGTLRNPRPSHFGWFGFSLEEAAGNLFVSSESAFTSKVGQVYVYADGSVTPSGTLSNPLSPERNEWGFGYAIKESQGDVFVSAPGAFKGNQETGAIYRYDGATLTLELTIPSPQPQSATRFGQSLSTQGSLLLAGAPWLEVSGEQYAGGAYLFDAVTGALLQTFLNPEPQTLATFGESVAIVGDFAVIGASGYSPNPPDYPASVGAAFVFELNTGTFVTRIDSPSPEQNDWFTRGDGTSLTSIRGQLAIGHGFDGQVHLYTVPEPTGWKGGLAALIVVLGVARRN